MLKFRNKKKKNEFAKLHYCNCGYCTRQIIVEHEKDGKVFMKDGKPMCMICRAVKLSKFKEEIESSKQLMVDDLKNINEQFEKEESERIIHEAAIAQENLEKASKKKVKKIKK